MSLLSLAFGGQQGRTVPMCGTASYGSAEAASLRLNEIIINELSGLSVNAHVRGKLNRATAAASKVIKSFGRSECRSKHFILLIFVEIAIDFVAFCVCVCVCVPAALRLFNLFGGIFLITFEASHSQMLEMSENRSSDLSALSLRPRLFFASICPP